MKRLIFALLILLVLLICAPAYILILIGTKSHLAAIPFVGLMGTALFMTLISFGNANLVKS